MANDTIPLATTLALESLRRVLPKPPTTLDVGATLGDGSTFFQVAVADRQALSLGAVEVAAISELELSAAVTADADGTSVQIVAQVDAQISLLNGAVSLALGGEFRELRSDGQSASSLRFSAVALEPISLTGLLSPFGVTLPSAFDVLSIHDLNLSVERDAQWAASSAQAPPAEVRVLASGTLGGDGSWEVIPGILTITAPAVAIAHQGGRTWVEIGETLELFGAWWRVSLQLPAGVGSASLRSAITMEALVEHFGLHDPTGTLAGLEITWASLTVDHGSGRMGVELEITSTWSLGPLALESLRFALMHDPTGVAGGLRARARFANVEFTISASHPGPGLGWNLEGYADLSAAPLRLETLLTDLGQDAGAAQDLLHASLTGIALSHVTLTGETRLDLYGSWGDDKIELHLVRQPGQAAAAATDATVPSSAPAAAPGAPASAYSFRGQWIHHDAVMSLALQDGVTVAAYSGGGGGKLSLAALLTAEGGALDLTVTSALVARKAATSVDAAQVLVAAEIGVELSAKALQKIPVLGERLGADASFGLSLHALYGAGADKIRGTATALVPVGLPDLPPSIPDGLAGSRVDVRIGTRTIPLNGFVPRLQQDASASLPPSSPPTPVHENLGGVVGLRSVRPSAKGQELHLSVDGAIRFGPVTLDAIGLDIGWDFKDSRPTVPSLDGFALSLDKPPLQVAGGFLHVEGDFVGKAEIHTSKFALTALGGFTLVGGSPSLFLYGLLLEPLGGPAFFFVEGLAAGFGLNRSLRLPTLDEVETFPLVVDAMAPPGGVQGGDQLSRLHDYIAPKVGAGFLAVGVKFTSFRLVHGFVLAIVCIDTITGDFEVAVVGTGELVTPPEAPVGARMAYVRLDILAKMSSRDSSLLVEAKLGEGCFVINPACHISGGMAFATWYGGEHAGDFVLSVGGYHPQYTPPAHYPVPKRLTLDYHISDGLHASGSLYFALTPNNLMFGFAFNATWSTGPVSAWFDLSLDFLMKFKPLHYDATGHLEIGASVDAWLFTVHVSAGADLHIWGPDLGGHACVHLGPFHGDLSFGAPVTPPPALTNVDFVKAFLPATPAEVLSIQPAGGLRSAGASTAAAPARWSFNPKEFALDLQCLVPLDVELTIPPMSDDKATVRARYTLVHTLEREGQAVKEAHVKPSDRKRRFPPALWKTEAEDVGTCGVRLSAQPIAASTDPGYSRHTLCATGTKGSELRAASQWSTEAHLVRSASDRAADRGSYTAELASANAGRDTLLRALARALRDPALAPEQTNWRVDVDALLDPPLPGPL